MSKLRIVRGLPMDSATGRVGGTLARTACVRQEHRSGRRIIIHCLWDRSELWRWSAGLAKTRHSGLLHCVPLKRRFTSEVRPMNLESVHSPCSASIQLDAHCTAATSSVVRITRRGAPFCRAARPNGLCGCLVPPVPIPNTEVKQAGCGGCTVLWTPKAAW